MPIPQLNRRHSRHYGTLGQQEEPEPRRSKKFDKKKWLKRLGILAVFGFGLTLIFGTVLLVWANRNLPDPDRLNERPVAQSTKIYDRTGTHLLYEVYQDQKRTLVELEQIADYAKKATIAAEDRHFYEHRGIRITSIIRAGINNLIGRRAGSGGASTLTQQLIKKTLVGDDRTYTRKIKEAILALRLERKYNKNQILKMYLNEIPYGSTNYGIEAASQSYFKKSAKDLTLAESATIAALPKAPSRYLNDPEKLKIRRDYILDTMAEIGYVSEEQRDRAKQTASSLASAAGILEAPHFVLYVKQLLADQFGEAMVDSGGLKVITSLDYDKQKIAEDAVKQMGEKNAKEANANNTALVAIDPKTGQILAMVGSRDFNNDKIDGKFNVAVLGRRQPGSSFKPFVYLLAMKKGYTPNTVLYDVVTDFDLRNGQKYTPHNYNGKEYGLVTMRKALAGSLNIPAVKTLYLVGVNEAIEFSKGFGYSTFTGDYGLSLVLGGAEVNLMEHANGYATLANNGAYHRPVSILRVTSPNGDKLFEWKNDSGEQAVEPELAAAVTNILSDNSARAYIFGSRNNLTLAGRPVAAKTGTTNDSKDAWTMGYTPSLAAGVWVGNTIPAPMKGGGNALAGVIWNKFMREALKNTKAESFPPAPPNTAEKPVLRGADNGITLRINRLTGKIAASTTPAALVVERGYLPPHDILHYVNRADPAGPAPANPADDPQYLNWENALQAWVERQRQTGKEVTLEEPPTEHDPEQSPELMPAIEVVSPADGTALNSRSINIQINTTAPRGVAQVILYVDENQIATLNNYPFTYNYQARALSRGTHTLKVVASDDIGTTATKEVRFNLDVEPDPPSVDWIDASPLSISAADFPRAMYLTPFRWSDMKNVQIYLASGDSGRRLIFTFTPDQEQLTEQRLIFTWNRSPGSGTHELTAVMSDKNGRVEEKKLQVEVR